MTQDRAHGTEVTRRVMLAGAGAAGLAGALAGCGMVQKDVQAAASQQAIKPAKGSPSAEAGGGAMADSGGTALAAASEIPVGGGMVFTAAKVVVTQPAAGEFKAFSAVCTHAQCLVDKVAMGTIDCPCHGSQFSVKDGSVVSGPAPSPLPAAANVTVKNGKVILA